MASIGLSVDGATGSAVTSPIKLSLMTALGWGFASFVIAVVNSTYNFVLLRYLTDTVGISSAFAGSAVAIAKIVDAVAHPAVGALSDRTKTRFGRRRPFILGGGVVCALAVLGTFNLHHIEAIRWAMTFTLVGLIVFGLGFALIIVPTIAMSAEMTDDFHERMKLVSVRVYMLGAGQLIGSSFGPLMLSAVGGGGHAYTALAFSIAAITILGCLVSFFMTSKARATVPIPTLNLTVAERIRTAAGNKPFLALLFIKIVLFTGVAVSNGLSAYFTKYVLHVSDAWLGIYNILKMVGWLAAQHMWVRLVQARGKRFTFASAAICYALAYSTWITADAGVSEAGIVIRGLLIGVATGGVALSVQAMLPDTIQYDHLKSGLRREGVFSGVYSLSETCAFSIGATLMGFLLAHAGYISGVGGSAGAQPASAIAMIHYAYMGIPMAAALLSMLALPFYELSRTRMDELTARFAMERAAAELNEPA